MMLEVCFHARVARLAVLVVAGAAVAACYDSTWGETKRAQRRAAQASTPATVQAASPESAGAASRTTAFPVRVLATSRFAAQTVEWQKSVRELFADANRVLEPSVGAHLDIERMDRWEASDADDDLAGALTRLHAEDNGDGAQWVIGFVGGLPRLTDSFHDVGRADVLGRHVVLRAAARHGEADQIERSFDELSAEERARLRRERQRHRALTTLLHEIGHTLGAPHERGAQSIMHAAYDPKMEGYSVEATEMMRIAIGHRARAPIDRRADDREIARELSVYLRGSSSAAWSAKERDDTLAFFDALASSGPAPAASASSPFPPSASPAPAAAPSAPPPPSAPEPLAGLRDADRPKYERAWTLFQSGYATMAYDVARPLFAAYPDLYAIQDLRCQIAVLRRLDEAARTKECAALKRLSGK